MSDKISYFARTNARRPFRTFGIKQPDRLSHMYIVGKTGTGKTTLIETLVRQDIAAPEAVPSSTRMAISWNGSRPCPWAGAAM
jgi:predicted ATPase